MKIKWRRLLKWTAVVAGAVAIAYGVAILSISLTPAVNLLQARLNSHVEKRVPDGLKRGLAAYLSWIEAARLAAGQSGLVKLVVRPFSRIVISFLLLNAVVILASILIDRLPVPERFADWEILIKRGSWGVAALICLPLLVDIVRNLNVMVALISEVAFSRRSGAMVGRFMRDVIQGVFFTLVLFIFSLVFLAACGRYFPTSTTLVGFVLVCLGLAILFWRRVVRVHSRFEYAVIHGMEGQSRASVRPTMEESIRRVSAVNPWPVRIEEMMLAKDNWACGRRIRDMNLPGETGATIVAIERSRRLLLDVRPDMALAADDRICLLGEREQIESARAYLTRPVEPEEVEPLARHFDKVLIGPTCDLVGQSLIEADLRRRMSVTVVGIQRGDRKIIGPAGGEVIHAGDLLLVMGRADDLAAFKVQVFES